MVGFEALNPVLVLGSLFLAVGFKGGPLCGQVGDGGCGLLLSGFLDVEGLVAGGLGFLLLLEGLFRCVQGFFGGGLGCLVSLMCRLGLGPGGVGIVAGFFCPSALVFRRRQVLFGRCAFGLEGRSGFLEVLFEHPGTLLQVEGIGLTCLECVPGLRQGFRLLPHLSHGDLCRLHGLLTLRLGLLSGGLGHLGPRIGGHAGFFSGQGPALGVVHGLQGFLGPGFGLCGLVLREPGLFLCLLLLFLGLVSGSQCLPGILPEVLDSGLRFPKSLLKALYLLSEQVSLLLQGLHLGRLLDHGLASLVEQHPVVVSGLTGIAETSFQVPGFPCHFG